MINLQPIARNIQKRLLEKMRVLGRTSSTAPGESTAGEREGLTNAKVTMRTPFLRMTSNLPNAVTLMGGKLKDDGTMPGGYDEIYGPRTYRQANQEDQAKAAELYNEENFSGYNRTQLEDIIDSGGKKIQVNTSKRPMPGLKSADIVFKGSMGLRSLREATISWVCWDWGELDELMPHFLAHGQTVLLQWGWVYDKKSLQEIPTFLKKDKFSENSSLDASAFKNYQTLVNKFNGDFDMMVGIIKNFEFTTRDDGGFDCQTIITSVGQNLLDNPEPSSTVGDPSIVYNLSLQENDKDIADKLKEATGDEGTDNTTSEDKDTLIKLNSNITLKAFIAQINEYLQQDLQDSSTTSATSAPSAGGTGYATSTSGKYQYKKNKYILRTEESVTSYGPDSLVFSSGVSDAWIRWGWFEDNILSKFLSLTNEKDEPQLISSFRSIESIVNSAGDPTGDYESVRIKNHERLRTTNLNHYILPNQFDVVQKQDITDGEKLIAKINGDPAKWIELASIVNDVNNFDPFATEIEEKTIKTKYSGTGTVGSTYEEKIDKVVPGNFYGPPIPSTDESTGLPSYLLNKDTPLPTTYSFSVTTESAKVKNFKTGYLRNMLINTKLIKEAFGVSDVDEFTIENISVIESLDNLFSLINREVNFWNFSITNDGFEPTRSKIIDEQITAIDFTKKDPIRSQITKSKNFKILEQTVGVFEFPVWKSTSFIKRQNISAKIPDAMQLAIMYGANADKLKEFSNFGSRFGDSSGVAAGMLYGKPKSGLDIAILNEFSQTIGNKSGDANEPLSPQNKSDDVLAFIKKNTALLENTYEARLLAIDDELAAKKQEKIDNKYTDLFDSSIPPPLFTYLSNQQKIDLFVTFEEAKNEFGLKNNETLVNRINESNEQIGILFGSNYNDDGTMKQAFIKSVSYYTSIFTEAKTNNNPILIPLDLELDIDGIGGIYPGNSFHSSYVPRKYKNTTLFQAFDVNHRVSVEGWTVTLTGKMRTSIGALLETTPGFDEQLKKQLENYQVKSLIVVDEGLKKDAEAINKQLNIWRASPQNREDNVKSGLSRKRRSQAKINKGGSKG